jgi:hypothetical protein
MKKVTSLSLLALFLIAGSASAQNPKVLDDRLVTLKPEQCSDTWTNMMTGSKSFAQAGAAVETPALAQVDTDFAQVDTSNDGTIDKKEFEAACGKGLVQGRRGVPK